MPQEVKITASKFIGYRDDPRNAYGDKGEAYLSSPSSNVRITRGGEAYTRYGYEDTGFDLAEEGSPSRPFHVSRYNVTFFCLNGKVKFIDHDNSDAVVDTGISLTDTTGANTHFAEYAGDIYLTNQTDGLRQIHMGRVNETAADLGDANITVDQDLVGRLIAFGDGAGDLRIANDTPFVEAYTSVAATGVITLTGTLNEDVADNAIVYTVENISSGRPKGFGLTFWKERMIVWGVVGDQNSYNGTVIDDATNVVYMTKFATRDTIENVIDFDTSGTAAIEQVGKGGAVTNVIGTRDYLYYFTETETYFSSVADVNQTTGETIPQLMDNKHGCIGIDCACDLGNGVIAILDVNKRIWAIKISTDTGAAVVFPDESFDQDIRNTLELMDTNQASSHMFYHSGERIMYAQVQIDSEQITLVRDNNIGKWLPPDTNKVFLGYYEKDGVLFATDLIEDTIYQVNVGLKDNEQDIDCTMATGIFEFEGGRITSEWREIELAGSITQDTTITCTGSVDGGTSAEKLVVSTDYSFSGGRSFSDVSIGSLVIGGGGVDEQIADWEKRYRIAPTSYGKSFQPMLQSNGAFTWKAFVIRLSPLNSSLITLS